MLKIGVEIPKLAQKYNGYPFFGPPCMLVTSNSSHVHYFLSRRSIGPGQTDVLSLLGRLADWARLELRRPWSFCGVLFQFADSFKRVGE